MFFTRASIVTPPTRTFDLSRPMRVLNPPARMQISKTADPVRWNFFLVLSATYDRLTIHHTKPQSISSNTATKKMKRLRATRFS